MKPAPSELLFMPALREWVENRTLIFITLLSGNSAFLCHLFTYPKQKTCCLAVFPADGGHPLIVNLS